MRDRVPRRRRICGQALTETLASLLALVPLFILVPYIGKYLDVKHKATDAARYAVWERTVWSDAANTWGAQENNKSDAEIALELGDRVLGHPRAPVLPPQQLAVAGVSTNPLWRDYTGANLVALQAYQPSAPVPGVSVATLAEQADPVPYGPLQAGASLVELVAFDGLELAEDLNGLTEFGLGLNQRGLAESRVSVPLVQLPTFARRGVSVDLEAPAGDVAPITMSQTGAILSDAWVPGSEDNFRARLDGLVTDEALQLIVAPGTFTFGFFPVFIEGIDGQDPQLESDSDVLPADTFDFGNS